MTQTTFPEHQRDVDMLLRLERLDRELHKNPDSPLYQGEHAGRLEWVLRSIDNSQRGCVGQITQETHRQVWRAIDLGAFELELDAWADGGWLEAP